MASPESKYEEQVVVGMYDRGLLGFPEGGIRLKSGRVSPYYYNDRPHLSFNRKLHDSGAMSFREQRDFRRALARSYGEKFQMHLVEVDHVVGKAQAATAPAALGAYEAGMSYLWERVDEPGKTYGAHQRIEGNYQEGELVLIADDVVTDAKSKKEAIQTLGAVGLKVTAATIKFDRQEGGAETLEGYGLSVNAVTSLSRAMDILFENGRIGFRQLDAVAGYHEMLRMQDLPTTYVAPGER